MKTIVHVNQHVIKANAKNGESNPTLTVKTYKSGAKVWIETEGEVLINS